MKLIPSSRRDTLLFFCVAGALLLFCVSDEAWAEPAVHAAVDRETLDAANRAVLDAGLEPGDIAYPVAAGVANVKAYGAVGDGVTDDTAAIQAALDAEPRNHLIYLPRGTYLISDTLRWAGTSLGNNQKRQILQGQSRNGTVIRLKDRCEGITCPDRPKAMIWTGRRPAQRWRAALPVQSDRGT